MPKHKHVQHPFHGPGWNDHPHDIGWEKAPRVHFEMTVGVDLVVVVQQHESSDSHYMVGLHDSDGNLLVVTATIEQAWVTAVPGLLAQAVEEAARLGREAYPSHYYGCAPEACERSCPGH